MSNYSNGRGLSSESYKEKIRAYRTKNLYRALLAIVIVVVVALIVHMQYVNHVYTGYEIKIQSDRSKSADSVDTRLGKSILTYSKDGAYCLDSKGNILWNQTYEIQDPLVSISGSVVGIANYNGRDIYVLNENEQLYKITTNMPIRNICVAENGYCTVVIYDTNVTYINTYNSKGELIFNGQTHMSNSGYPAALALSPNGKLLSIAYMYVDAGTIKTTVAFYNFGSVGDNYTDYLVSGFDYSDVVVPQVGYLSNGTSYAIADNRIMFYSGDEKPTTKNEFLLEQEILSVFSNDGYLGVVFVSDSDKGTYKMSVYDSSGDLEGDYYFDLDYRDIVFEKNNFVVYNESECIVETYEGKIKFEGTFDSSVTVMNPTDKAYNYIIADDSSIKVIQLN